MRAFQLALLVLLPLSASERGLGGEVSAEEKKATIQYLEGLRDKETGAFKNTLKDKPSLRATNGAVKALKALGAKVTDIEKIQKFVLSRYDAKTGAFSEPDGKPDATVTSIGIIVACEVGIDKKDFPKAMEYVLANAKEFEEVRIGAAAVEAWGAKGLKLERFMDVVDETVLAVLKDGNPRESSSVMVTYLRLGLQPDALKKARLGGELYSPKQSADGGWSKKGANLSDIESTYRVMRAIMMLKSQPTDIPQLRKFIASHRNKDGGYAAKAGVASSAGGTYFAVIISKWLDDMEAKK